MYNLYNAEMYEVIFEIFMNGALYNRQKVTAPDFVLIQQFMGAVNNIIASRIPRSKVTMTRWEAGWDKFEGKQIPLEYKIEFSNYME